MNVLGRSNISLRRANPPLNAESPKVAVDTQYCSVYSSFSLEQRGGCSGVGLRVEKRDCN